jgi:hypothetical protein
MLVSIMIFYYAKEKNKRSLKKTKYPHKDFHIILAHFMIISIFHLTEIDAIDVLLTLFT